jgi:hypothetical protein
VTVLLPFTYLAYRGFSPALSVRARFGVWFSLILSSLLMATTSSEFGGLFFSRQGHKIAQFFGMFFWAGVVLFVATAWRVRAEREDPSVAAVEGPALAGPHARMAGAAVERAPWSSSSA